MSFAEDLWDGFSLVSKWEQQGIVMCKSICKFYRKRAKIEEAYGKSLFKLVQKITEEIQQPNSYCHDSFCHGTLGSGWVAMCHNAQIQSELHLNVAEQIRKNIVDNLQINTIQLEDQLKQVTKEGERLLIDQEQWLSTLKKVKQTYYKTVKEAESARCMFDESLESKAFSSKAEKRVIKASQEAQATELAYLGQIKHTNYFMHSFNNELMPRIMKRMEDIGRSRQQLILHHFKELSRLSDEIPNGLISASNALTKAINQVDVNKDIQDFIRFNRSQQHKVPPFQYEPPSEEMSPTMDHAKKKHFFTLARKINNNIFGSPTSKGNAGSPPSLSPSPSTIFTREKPFKFPIFGQTLDTIMDHQREIVPDCEVPYFLLVLVLDMFRSKAQNLEGVFRVPAPNHELEVLAKQFDNGNYDLSSVQSPYTTSSLVKKWCRDLPDPLIPSYLYERCIACNNCNELKEIVPMLPPLYQKVVVFLAQLLHEFSLPEYSDQSKMNAANFAMVFTPSFLRCSSTEMADFLLNVHREKNFVQLLIEGVEERLTTETLEEMIAPADEVIFSKETTKWHSSKPEVPPLQISAISDNYNAEFRSELQRQESEREMILVKQQQLIKLTARDDLTDPKSLHSLLLNERSEKEKCQDSLSMKDKTIKIMKTELTNTLQEKLHLENAVKSLQLRIEKLETHIGDSRLSSPRDNLALAWSPLHINVKENIQNYEKRTRSFRSGSVDTGVARLQNSWPRRSFSPSVPFDEKRSTVHLGDNFRITIAPFKLPIITTTPPLQPLTEELASDLTPSRNFSLSPTPLSPRRRNDTPTLKLESPRKSGDLSSAISPRRGTIASPRGVSFRDLNTVHVYSHENSTIITNLSPVNDNNSNNNNNNNNSNNNTANDNSSVSNSTAPTRESPRQDITSPRIPRIRLSSLSDTNLDTISPRNRHSLQLTSVSPRASPPSSLTQSSDFNSPRNPRHSTPAESTSPRSTSSYSLTLKNTLENPNSTTNEDPSSLTRTVSYSGIKRKNTLTNSISLIPTNNTKKGEFSEGSKKSNSKSSKGLGNSGSLTKEDHRIYDLINTNVQKYDILTKPTTASPKPVSPSFPHKLRLLIQKQPKNSEALPSPSSVSSLSLSKLSTVVTSSRTSDPDDEPHKSPRSPRNTPRPNSPRNPPLPRSLNTSKESYSSSLSTSSPTVSRRKNSLITKFTSSSNLKEQKHSGSTPSLPTFSSPPIPDSNLARSMSPVFQLPPSISVSPTSTSSSPLSTSPEEDELLLSSSPSSPRQPSRRTLSFPTPRVQNSSLSSMSVVSNTTSSSSSSDSSSSTSSHSHLKPQSPRPSRSQIFVTSPSATPQDLLSLALDVDKMKKEVHKRLCGCVEIISNTADYTQTIEISKSIRLLIKCLDLALLKLGVEERQTRQLGTGKSSLPEVKISIDDSRLKKLRDILVISLDRIVDQMRCLANLAAQITTVDEMNIILQTLGEMQLFFSKQDQAITKVSAQDVMDGIKQKIERLKTSWNQLPLDRQVDVAKVVIDLKKDLDEYCSDNSIAGSTDQLSLTTPPHMVSDTQSERITKTIFMTLDKIYNLCMSILQHIKGSLQISDDGSFTEKLMEVFKSLSTK